MIKIEPKSGFFNSFNLEGLRVHFVNISPENKEVILEAEVLNIEGVEEIKKIKGALEEKVEENFVFGSILTFADEKILHEIVDKEIAILKKSNVSSKIYLEGYKIAVGKDEISIMVAGDMAVDKLEGVAPILAKNLEDRLFMKWGVKLKKCNEIINYEERFEEHLKQKEEEQDRERAEHHKYILGKKITKKVIPISKFYDADFGDEVAVEGMVFNFRIIKTGEERFILIFNLSDNESSLSAKAFLRSDKIKIDDNSFIRIKGKKSMDDFNVEESLLSISDITEISTPPVVEDRSEEKRVELHAHTKMSEMDSILDVEQYIDRAVGWGHKAVAITDGGVVHGFPQAHSYASKFENFKVIFGMEGYVVDDVAPSIYGSYDKSAKLSEATFSIFDIETTGLNPHGDKIIEIAAVRVEKGKIVTSYSSLIDPGIKIPEITTELTGITDDMLKGAPSFEEVFRGFEDFVEGSILVAHNASFDMGFMGHHASLLGSEFNYAHIDTLQWCRDIYPDNKKHGLKDMGKMFGMEFRHHRALDDANVTAHIFIKILEELSQRGIISLGDSESMERSLFHSFPNNTNILVKNREGLRNLYSLVSDSHLRRMKKIPKISKKLLMERREGLLLGASMIRGEIFNDYLSGVDPKKVMEKLKFYDFMELVPPSTFRAASDSRLNISLEDVEDLIKKVVDLCDEVKIPIVATGSVKYLDENEHLFRKILKIEGKAKGDEKMFFRTTKQMLDEFKFLGSEKAREIVIENTNTIADEIEKLSPVPKGFFPPKMEGAKELVRKITYEKAKDVYGNNLPEMVEKRIERELNAIIGNGFAVLYYLSHKLVKKSLDDGYLVGSRGSVGSSFVAWLMGITEVNSLYPHYLCPKCKYIEFIEHEGSGVDLPNKKCKKCEIDLHREGHSIPFEVFMGFKGEKVPDIDLNFSGEYQPRVHKYVEELFGKENVFRAGTISTLAKKNAFGYARKYVEDNELSLPKAHIEYFALKCEGARKTTGQHPGGVIIVPEDRDINDFTPIQKPANDFEAASRTTHFDYHVMDKQLVKMDILGHDDPTTLKILEDYSGLSAVAIPLDDPKTLSIFNSTKALGLNEKELGSPVGTYGIPEFGTPFSRRMLSETRPTTFAELVRISGLSHGISVWTNNAQKLIKSGVAKLADVISVRDDIMNYLIDQGIPKGEAFNIMEFIRKGLPSKDIKKWQQYIEVMKNHNISDWYISSCEKITYMFPKGHAVAYVLMAVRIAYFKVHRPIEFYSAYLSRKVESFDFELYTTGITGIKNAISNLNSKSRLDAKGKSELYVLEILLEMSLRKIEILPIDLYKSSLKRFTPEDGKIRAPLTAMKGLGLSVAENIIREREEPFISFEDLRRRTRIPKTICDLMKQLKIVNLQELNQMTLF